MPKGIRERVIELMPYPEVFREKLKKSILPIIEDKRFLHSWRGTFMSTELNEEIRKRVIEELSKLEL